jgi:hypothetical protein
VHRRHVVLAKKLRTRVQCSSCLMTEARKNIKAQAKDIAITSSLDGETVLTVILGSCNVSITKR